MLAAGGAGAPPHAHVVGVQQAALIAEGGSAEQRTAAARTTASATTSLRASYELMSRSRATAPLHWLACRPIDFRINPTDMPAGMDTVVRSTMGIIGRQVGVSFHYAGRTTRTFGSTSRPASPTIYFSFTHKRKAYGQVFAWPGEIGVGGPAAAWSSDGDGHVFEAVTAGRVLLSTTFQGRRTGAGATWQSLIVHEVGHALNLAHRKSKSDAMYPELTSRSPGRFAPDEVAALKRVLQRSGCDYAAWSRL